MSMRAIFFEKKNYIILVCIYNLIVALIVARRMPADIMGMIQSEGHIAWHYVVLIIIPFIVLVASIWGLWFEKKWALIAQFSLYLAQTVYYESPSLNYQYFLGPHFYINFTNNYPDGQVIQGFNLLAIVVLAVLITIMSLSSQIKGNMHSSSDAKKNGPKYVKFFWIYHLVSTVVNSILLFIALAPNLKQNPAKLVPTVLLLLCLFFAFVFSAYGFFKLRRWAYFGMLIVYLLEIFSVPGVISCRMSLFHFALVLNGPNFQIGIDIISLGIFIFLCSMRKDYLKRVDLIRAGGSAGHAESN